MKPSAAIVVSLGSLMMVLLSSLIVSARGPMEHPRLEYGLIAYSGEKIRASVTVGGSADMAGPGDILTNTGGDMFIGASLTEELCDQRLKADGYPWEGYALMILVGVLFGAALAGKLIELTFPKLLKWQPLIGAALGAVASGPFVSGFPELGTGGFVFAAIGGLSASWIGPAIRSAMKAGVGGVAGFFVRKSGE